MKLCINCINYTEEFPYLDWKPYCKRNGLKFIHEIDPVNGHKSSTPDMPSCKDERSCGECGEDAIFYERRKGIFDFLVKK